MERSVRLPSRRWLLPVHSARTRVGASPVQSPVALVAFRDLPAAGVDGGFVWRHDALRRAQLRAGVSCPHHAHASHHQIRHHVAPAPIKAPPNQLHHQHRPTSNLFWLHCPKHSRQSSKVYVPPPHALHAALLTAVKPSSVRYTRVPAKHRARHLAGVGLTALGLSRKPIKPSQPSR